MYQKQKGLVMNRENLAKIHVTEIKRLRRFFGERGRGKKRGKIGEKFL
jgi:hypothetical protein